MTRLVLSVLAWITFTHLAGLYLFTRGFLLTRLSLPDASSCLPYSATPCTLPPRHKRAVLLIIDALRFDFISPDPPTPESAFHHRVLTLPAELSASSPQNSILFDAYADPPTTTLQRIKGLTTGSLPTFIDMGSNFGGSSIEEDSLIKQLLLANKKLSVVAFTGDDTWTTVFPTSLSPSFPYDSFNVEDLHTVDEGVIRHLFPLLHPTNNTWGLLIGHFLGVDHVGHRLGPDHPAMRAKLLQMDRVLRQVVDVLEEDDLLIVLGDHGMDRGGDHGGDGVLETSAGLWMYSKTPLRNTAAPPMELSLAQQTKVFPGAMVSHRRVQQIDLVPTISLLLGLPIPFNNLGAVIPELFDGKDLDDAVAANAAQVGRYLDTYRASASGSELDAAWTTLENLRNETTKASAGDKAEAQATYLRAALAACRAMWAQFNSASMALGLLSLAMSLAASAALFVRLGAEGGAEIVGDAMAWSIRGMAAGAIGGTLLSFLTGVVPAEGIDALDWILFLAPFCGALVVIGTCLPPPSLWTAGAVVRTVASTPLVLVLHTAAFFSNSFTFWEDRIILFFLVSTLAEPVRTGLAVPSSALRARILRAAGVFAVAARAMGSSTVCREEQQPYCRVTFFASASVAVPPVLVRVLVLPVALALPALIRWRLSTAKAHHGSAALVLPHALRPALVAGSIYWLLDWADTVDYFGVDAAPLLRTIRTVVAWTAVFFVTMGAAGGFLMPACIKVNVDGDPQKPERVTVLGYANAFGAPYLVLWSVALALVWLSSQLTGQLMLALGTVALLAHLELVDALRDAHVLNAALASATPSKLLDLQSGAETPFVPGTLRFGEVVPLALLAMHAFFATGHQATVPSIQWKPAFMLTPGVSYPLSPMLVALNAFGPVFVVALAAPLLAAWNVAPRGGDAVALGAGRAALALQAYFGALLLGAAGSAAHLRRHLMVWKVFAPRFMLGAATLLAVDTAAILGLLALGPVVRYMARVFGPAVADAVRPA